MTHDEYSESQTSGASPECAALAPLLTALFDGEASDGAPRVQAHLQSCAQCAEVWQQWQSARAFLNAACEVSRASAPPSLAERIQLACRASTPISALPEYSAAACQLEETLFEAARGFEPQPFTPALKPFFMEATPPADLQQKILRATVGARQNQLVPQFIPIASRSSLWREIAGRWFTPPALRWSGALAVPALAAFLLIVARAPQNSNLELSATAPSQLAPRVTHHDTSTRNAPSAPKVASKTASDSFSLSRIAFGEAHAALTSEHRAATSGAPMREEARYADWQEAPATSHAASTPRVIEVSAQTGRSLHTLKIRAALWTREATSPRAIRAFSTRASVRPVVYNGARRDRRATSPSETPRVIEASFDETLDAVSRLRDDRPEDVRQVVDSYRAALVSNERDDDNDDDLSDDDLL